MNGRALPEILVINLDDARERWDFVREELARVGLTATRLPAVDGRAPGFRCSEYAPHGRTGLPSRWELTRTEAAIFASHRSAWRRALEPKGTFTVICEDDLLVSSCLPKALEQANLANYGVVKLDGTIYPRKYGPEQRFGKLAVRPILQASSSAGCYALSPSAARRLLSDSENFSEWVDNFVLRRRAGVHPAQVWPAVALQAVCADLEAHVHGRDVPQCLALSGRERVDAAASVVSRGPISFRIRKELARLAARTRHIGRRREDVPLSGDLPPYRR